MQCRVSIPTFLYVLAHNQLVGINYLQKSPFHGIDIILSSSAPVIKTLSRLLFHLVVERLPPSILTQRRFTASFNTDDDDFVKFPSDSIFPGSSLAGIDVWIYQLFLFLFSNFALSLSLSLSLS